MIRDKHLIDENIGITTSITGQREPDEAAAGSDSRSKDDREPRSVSKNGLRDDGKVGGRGKEIISIIPIDTASVRHVVSDNAVKETNSVIRFGLHIE